MHPDGNGLHTIARLVNTGRVAAVIDSLYDMRDASQAHRKVEGGHVRGKVILKIED